MRQELVMTSTQYRNPTSCSRSVKLSRVIALLLVVLIVVALVAHNYLSEFNSDGELPSGYRSRKNMDHSNNDEFMYTAPNLNDEIQKLNKIKASVNNELRDMESRRQKLLSQISKFHMEIEDLRVTQESIEKEIKTTRLSLDQLRLQKDELDEKYVPILKAPQKILLGNEASQSLPLPSSVERCKMYSCFDYSRCSLLSHFPVYFYDPFQLQYDKSLERFIKTSVMSSLAISPYVTQDAKIACIYVVLVGQLSSSETDSVKIQTFLHSLPHWHGDGRNHILMNVMRNYESSDIFSGVNIGRAIVVQSTFVETYFREGFDVVIPPSFGKSDGQVWEELPLISPIRRKYFLSFWGLFKGVLPVGDDKLQTKDKVDDSQTLTYAENFIISSLKNLQTAENQEIFVQFSCDSAGPGAINGEWSLCGTVEQRKEILLLSTFSLIIAPSNISYVSTSVFQLRLYESLKYGAIPVILGDYVQMPFSDILDWKKAAIILPKARASEFYFILRTYTDNDVAAMRQVCRFYFETYFGTTKSIVDSILAVLRTRLSIPPTSIQDVPSPSVFNSSSPPLTFENTIVNPETDEVLGPLEPPFSSVRFKQNFTQYVSYQRFLHAGDPFELFPYTPFEKILPSESKYFGSGYGFRPIGKGWGGAGREFSESLGGNLPREQFTIVMLTYERETVLISAIQRLKGLPFLNKVIVVWNNPLPPLPEVRWPEIGVPILVIKTARNSLNNRFLPFDVIETEAILSIDDDAHLRHDEIVFGFRVWREEREKIVGFPGRFHAWDINTKSWYYNSNYSCELSMVLTGAAFFHKYYSYLYTHVMPQAIRDKVDEYMNCEDIAMNFLVSHVTRKPPIKVTSRWTFRCPGCPQTLSNDSSHFEERHKCINFFVRVYGYMPLLYTQYRVDSVLFKTRLPHDKQKCFKFI